jgi:membrane protease YdiL (CAAX protease family)
MPRLSATNRARLRRVFIGHDGLRGIWGILIFLAILGAVGAAAGVIAHHYNAMRGEVLRAPRLFGFEAATAIVVILASFIMSRIERRPLGSYGFACKRPVAHVLAGAVGGLACLSALAAILIACGFLVVDGVALSKADAVVNGLAWLAAFFMVGLSEEAIFRGYIQATLTRRIGFWPGALLMSLLFGASHLHNKGEDAAGIAGVVAAGLIFCLLLHASGSLWLGIGFHMTWDWAQTFLFGTPDSGLLADRHFFSTHAAGPASLSGGPAGPEGSLLAAPVTIAGVLVLLIVCRRMGMFSGQDGKEGLLF